VPKTSSITLLVWRLAARDKPPGGRQLTQWQWSLDEMAPGGKGGFRQAEIGAVAILGTVRRLVVVLVSLGRRRAAEALKEAWPLAVGLDPPDGDGAIALMMARGA